MHLLPEKIQLFDEKYMCYNIVTVNFLVIAHGELDNIACMNGNLKIDIAFRYRFDIVFFY